VEESRKINDKIIKANLKKKEECENEDDWESVEEDAPIIKLEELLDNLKLGDSDSDD
jgi:hypothetical protein